jgi:hypothetical protein
MINNIIHSIKSYIRTYHNPYHQVRIIPIKDKFDYYMICYNQYERDICIMVYNDTFIKINVDNQIYAICDGIKSVRYELDRLSVNYENYYRS